MCTSCHDFTLNEEDARCKTARPGEVSHSRVLSPSLPYSIVPVHSLQRMTRPKRNAI
jgi:hypothetical protein